MNLMSNDESKKSWSSIVKERVAHGKRELLSNPVLEISLTMGPFAGRLLNAATIPAFYYVNKLSDNFSTDEWRWMAAGVIGLSLITLSLTEYWAIRKRHYCTNTNTIFLNLALEKTKTAIVASRAWGLANIVNPVNPVDFGMATYLTFTGDWGTFLNFMVAREVVRTTYNSGVDTLIATGKLDPLYRGIQETKRKVRLSLARFSKRN